MSAEYPRVVSLSYGIVSDDTREYAHDAEPDGAIEGFSFRLRQRDAKFAPLSHIASEEVARSLLEPQLRAWELHATLKHGSGTLTFKFRSSHVQWSAPRPGVIEVGGVASMAITGMAATVKLTFHQHPAPPQGFAVDECVQALGELFLLARSTPLTVLYIAYSMTTCLKLHFESLSKAASRLGISTNLLDKIDELANTRGTGAEVRKFDARVKRKPLSEAERRWLMQALEAIVRRAAASAAGASVAEQITLETMPPPPGP